MYLVLSALTSSPISLIAATKASAFSFTVCMYVCQYVCDVVALADETVFITETVFCLRQKLRSKKCLILEHGTYSIFNAEKNGGL